MGGGWEGGWRRWGVDGGGGGTLTLTLVFRCTAFDESNIFMNVILFFFKNPHGIYRWLKEIPAEELA